MKLVLALSAMLSCCQPLTQDQHQQPEWGKAYITIGGTACLADNDPNVANALYEHQYYVGMDQEPQPCLLPTGIK